MGMASLMGRLDRLFIESMAQQNALFQHVWNYVIIDVSITSALEEMVGYN